MSKTASEYYIKVFDMHFNMSVLTVPVYTTFMLNGNRYT